MQAAIAVRQYLTAKIPLSASAFERSLLPALRLGLGIPLAESSSFLARVLTRRDKPKPRGDDSDSQSDDGIAELKDGLCPTALRADFGDNHQDRGCDSRSDRVTYQISLGTLYPLLRWAREERLPAISPRDRWPLAALGVLCNSAREIVAASRKTQDSRAVRRTDQDK